MICPHALSPGRFWNNYLWCQCNLGKQGWAVLVFSYCCCMKVCVNVSVWGCRGERGVQPDPFPPLTWSLSLSLSHFVFLSHTHTGTAAILWASPSAPEEKATAKRTLFPLFFILFFSFFHLSHFFLLVAIHLNSVRLPGVHCCSPRLSPFPPQANRLETQSSVGSRATVGLCAEFMYVYVCILWHSSCSILTET